MDERMSDEQLETLRKKVESKAREVGSTLEKTAKHTREARILLDLIQSRAEIARLEDLLARSEEFTYTFRKAAHVLTVQLAAAEAKINGLNEIAHTQEADPLSRFYAMQQILADTEAHNGE